MTTTATRPPFHVILDLADAATDLRNLLYLDCIWRAAERRTALGDRDRQGLVALGNTLDALVAAVERHAPVLRDICDSYGEWVNATVRSEFASGHLNSTQVDGIRRLLAVENGDYAGRARILVDSAAAQAPTERAELQGKIPALRGNQPAITDISDGFACNIMASSIVAELVLCPESLGITCVFAGAIYLMADDMGC